MRLARSFPGSARSWCAAIWSSASSSSAILIFVIQFIVIASGSQRVAEVAARFTLDAMPGKQMAIDADVHAGVLDADRAVKRELVQKEVDFYGAMDGAENSSKATRWRRSSSSHSICSAAWRWADLPRHVPRRCAANVRAALHRQRARHHAAGVPHLNGDGHDGYARRRRRFARHRFRAATFARPEILRVAGALLLALALVPALPRPVFIALGLSAFARRAFAQNRNAIAERYAQHEREVSKRQAIRRPEMALGLIGVDAVCIEIGANLLQLLAPPLCEALLDRVGEVRRALAAEIGVVLPGVRLRDDMARDPDSYAIRVRDELAGEGTLHSIA